MHVQNMGGKRQFGRCVGSSFIIKVPSVLVKDIHCYSEPNMESQERNWEKRNKYK